MKGNKSINTILWALIVLTLISLVSYGFLFYQIKAKSENTTQIVSDTELEVIRSDRYSAIEKTIKRIEDQASKLDKYVLGEKNIVDFLKLLETAGREQGLTIKTEIKKSEVADEAGDKSNVLDLTFSFSGSWRGIQNFIAMVESIPFKIKVKEVTIKKNNGEDTLWTGSIHFNVVMK